MATILTDVALLGYKASQDFRPAGVSPANPVLAWSPNWMGYEAGMAMERCGYLKPIKVTMGRGYAVNVWTVANRFKVTMRVEREPLIERLGEG